MSRSGAKTPMAGIFSGAVVVMALYVLTPAFFYIPEAVLGAVVIHAVVDLVSGPSFLYKLWKSSILETMIFVLAVVVTIFMDVETAIYISVGLSLLLMLLRLARPSISILGRVKLASSSSKHITTSSSSTSSTARDDIYGNENARYIYVDESDVHFNHLLDPLPEGILAIRLNHAILYPNANYIAECITHIVKSRTRPLANCSTVEAVWNQPSSKEIQRQDHHVPHLQALVLDFSGVNQLDATAIHTLHATREALDRYVGSPVDWHFCQLVNPQVRQALLDAGFGDATGFSVPLGISVHKDAIYNSAASMPTLNSLRDPMDDAVIMASTAYDHEYTSSSEPLKYNDMVLLPEDKYPAFHWDIESAVYAITSNSGSNKKNNASSITVTVY
jgi:MFS superfamily sulfate permease-like transporter